MVVGIVLLVARWIVFTIFYFEDGSVYFGTEMDTRIREK